MAGRRRRADEGRTARAFWLLCAGLGVAGFAHWAGARAATTAPRNSALHVAVTPIPGLSVAARLVVVAPAATNVIVHYGSDEAHPAVTTSLPVPSAGTLKTALVGLEPGATTHVAVVAHFVDGTATASGDVTVRMPPMDPELPAALPVTNDGTATGFVMMSLNQKELGHGLAVMLSRRGRVLWYRHCGGGAFDFERLWNGHFILHQVATRAFEELTLDGTVVRTWTDRESVTGADGHDFKLLPNGNALIFGAETRRVDSRAYFPGGVENALRWDDTVSEITPSGAVAWRWSSYGHLAEEEITEDPTDPTDPRDYEVVHTNAIEPMLDDTLLLSFRNLSSVAKIERATGRVLFRLGGKRSDFRFEGDPLGGFSRQHDARLVGPDRVLLFDDGNLHEPPQSRAVEYRLDERAKTATLVWEYRPGPALFSRFSGSVQRLPDGHTLIAWGPRGVVTEVDARSKPVWEVTIPGYGVYRARSAETIYP
ncbi:MAG TPA: arylsulfotransferase family protein [Polyangiaceae bacterium]|jgi:hypothetical protein|nr:arylsulfotransferase family protein [Polyangiaceae bacterium]